MATVFMKWLESSPETYERGIRLLTLGQRQLIHGSVVRDFVVPGLRVLELGCGTGQLAVRMAEKGARVWAVDNAPDMVAVARRKVAEAGLDSSADVLEWDARDIDSLHPQRKYDLIVASLVLSEMVREERVAVLRSCAGRLAAAGRLLVIDERVPERLGSRILYRAVRAPLALATWLFTRARTYPLAGFAGDIRAAGCEGRLVERRLLGSLALWQVVPGKASGAPSPAIVGRLRHRAGLATYLKDAHALLFRVIPPYPSVRPGLYEVGAPGRNSPVLVTGNYDLTVRRVVAVLDGTVDAWLLVVDSSGINVWCGAGGGFLTATGVIGAVRRSGVGELVSHRDLVLPQLAACGVDGWQVRRELGWRIRWGPVRAVDIPDYLSCAREKTEAMRMVEFPLKDRLEMVTATLGLYALMILGPILVLWRNMFIPVAVALVALSYFYAVVLPWLPGRDGLAKSVPLAVIALAGMLSYTVVWDPAAGRSLFGRVLGTTALSVLVAAELQGMSPKMRGEQANWAWEAVVGVLLLTAYFLVPPLVGWE